MITIEMVCVQVQLEPAELERWIGEAWIRPAGAPGAWRFRDIDVARVRLIRELRDELRVNEDALPIVLSLMDQLYAERRRLRRLRAALEEAPPASGGQELLARLLGESRGDIPDEGA